MKLNVYIGASWSMMRLERSDVDGMAGVVVVAMACLFVYKVVTRKMMRKEDVCRRGRLYRRSFTRSPARSPIAW